MSEIKKLKKAVAWIDGSYNSVTNKYGCGGFLLENGTKHIIKELGDDPGMATMHNVAGEILGAMRAAQKASDLGITELTIFHDYDGVAAWVNSRWKCRSPYTRKYASTMWALMAKGLKIIFKHVKSHSGNEQNDEADRLAKEAVGLA